MLKARLSTAILLCVVLTAGAVPGGRQVIAEAKASYRYFPETDHTINEPLFLEYWEKNGGLSRFGYPISGLQAEYSPSDRTEHTVQYFERAEFERHSGRNGQPPKVLLSLLGSAQYKVKYQGNAPNQIPNYSEGSLLVPETGKRIGGSFLQYWQANGDVMQLGYPISDEIREVSELDGKTYTMQYFERVVMEWHPGGTPPGDVQLSHLGRSRYEALYGPPDKLPASARVIAMDVLAGSLSLQQQVVVGQEIIYLRGDARSTSVCSYNLYSQEETVLLTRPFSHKAMTSWVADRTTIAWVQDLTGIHIYDRLTGIETQILQSEHPRFPAYSALAVDNGVLYFQDIAPEHSGLYEYDPATHKESLISRNGRTPVARDGLLLFTNVTGNNRDPSHLLLKKNGQLEVITEFPWPGSLIYSLSAKYIVWAGEISTSNRNVYLFDLDTKTPRKIETSADHAYVDDNYVATDPGTFMAHNPPRGGSIKLYNIEAQVSASVISDRQRRAGLCGIVDGKWLLFYRAVAYDPETQGNRIILYAMPINTEDAVRR